MKSLAKTRFLLLFCVVVRLQSQLIPDCDLEFSSQAIELIRSKIDDPARLNRIEIILSSCNKSRMQKLTEISVFLLEKGVFPSRVVDDIQRLAHRLKGDRYKRLEKMRQDLPSNLGKTVDEISSVLMSDSLSGNEKLLSLSNVIASLPRQYRSLIERFIHDEVTPQQTSPETPTTNDVHSFYGDLIEVVTDPSTNETRNPKWPKPYPAKDDVDRITEKRKDVSVSTTIRKSDVPAPLDRSSTPELFNVPPLIYKYNHPDTRLYHSSDSHSVGLITKNHRKPPASSQYVESIKAPMNPIVPTNARSQIVEVARKHTATAPIVDQLDDADLLNPRTSLLSDAVRLLERAIPRVNTELPRYVAPSNPRHTPPYTFPLPYHVYERPSPVINVANSQLVHQSLLPYRDDSFSSGRLDVGSTNDEMELARFDTNVGRFASGVATRVVLPSIPPIPLDEIITNSSPDTEFSQRKSIIDQIPSYNTHPDNREGLFPKSVSQVKYGQTQAKTPPASPTQQWSQKWNDKIRNQKGSLVNTNPSLANPGTMFVENLPSSQYGIAPRPKQTIDPQGRTTQSTLYPPLPSLPEPVITPLPEFRPYRSPEEITGSHTAREVYNVRHLGQPRFVKIDLLNE